MCENPIVIAGLTDGSVLLYQVRQDGLSLLLRTEKVHGFGVNAMDVVKKSESEFLVVTGGDD